MFFARYELHLYTPCMFTVNNSHDDPCAPVTLMSSTPSCPHLTAPSVDERENEWRRAFAPPYVFMVYTETNLPSHFTFVYIQW